MRFAFWIGLPLALLGQIGKPPEFQDAGTFQTSGAAGRVDGTSHVSAERAETNERLLALLRGRPGHAAGVRLIENQMLREAEKRFRQDGQPFGVAVAQFLSGATDASAAALLTLPADLESLPFLGETVGATPRLLTRIEAIATANPQNADAAYYLALALALQTPPRVAEAIAHLRRSAGLDAKGTRALLELGRQYAALDRRDEAIAAFEEVLQRDPAIKAAHYRLAQLYRAKGDLEKSGEHLRRYRQR